MIFTNMKDLKKREKPLPPNYELQKEFQICIRGFNKQPKYKNIIKILKAFIFGIYSNFDKFSNDHQFGYITKLREKKD